MMDLILYRLLLVHIIVVVVVNGFAPHAHVSQQNQLKHLSSSVAVPMPSSGETATSDDSPRIGVLLLNLGGPRTSEDVEGFLYNLFADPDIIRLPSFLSPLQGLIAWIIAKRRAPKSKEAYASIGGGSPILEYSQKQATLFADSLQQRYGLDVSTYIGMRYWHPFTEDALSSIRNDAVDCLVIVPLYPQFSISTSGSSLRVLQQDFASTDNNNAARTFIHTVIPSWYERPGYIRAMVNLIQHELNAFTPAQRAMAETDEEPLHILFSAHGVPQSYIQAGDPYQAQIEDCVDRISKVLLAERNDTKIHLSYQSRVGPIEWLRPYTDDVLPSLGEQGVKNLVVVPISFVSEHIETLEEIDMEYRELAEENGIVNWRRCPALNTDPAFIEDLADMVYEALQEPVQTVTEACVANSVSDLVVVEADDVVRMAGSGNSRGPLEGTERFNARVAIAGVLLTIAVEVATGQSLWEMLQSLSSHIL